MNVSIEPTNDSLLPNPVNVNTSVNVAISVYEYVPNEYKVSVRFLTTRNGNYFTTRNGNKFLVPFKVYTY